MQMKGTVSLKKKVRRRLLTYFPSHIKHYGIGHAALSIVETMNSEELFCQIATLSLDDGIKSKCIKTLLPSLLMRVIYKLLPQKKIRKMGEFIFLFLIKPNDIVYIWPGSSFSFVQKIKNKGNVLVTENINCHQKTSKKILDTEAAYLGIEAVDLITAEAVETEVQILELCDYVFSPSPAVTQSLLDAGINRERILASSYGLHEYQQYDRDKKNNHPDAITFIFVGRVGMRKGIHLLLDYWRSANIDNAILKIVGNIEAPVRDLLEPYKQDKSIQFIDFVEDVDKVYKEADVFILPSLEEGSPLVTYLALGAGLPCIVSPMGGEGVVVHGESGFIIEPHDKTAWVEAIQLLCCSQDLRSTQGISAKARSNRFLWQRVGRQRRNLLLEKLKE